jgi:hypothetical protein
MCEFNTKTNGLWAFQDSKDVDITNLTMNFNKIQSQSYPHCAICNLFGEQKQNESNQMPNESQIINMPKNSEILIPDAYFAKKSYKKNTSINQNNTSDKNICRLLQCITCKLTVHECKYLILNEKLLLDDSF